MLTNAHLHFDTKYSSADFCGKAVCFSAGSAEEWADATAFAKSLNDAASCTIPSQYASDGNYVSGVGRALVSAGLHPWSLVSGSADATGGAAHEAFVSGCAADGAVVSDFTEEADVSDVPDVSARLSWLEELLANNAGEVAAVGECGIDLYTPELKAALPAQLIAFEKQIELADRYEKPLVVHCRRSIQYFFEYAPRLKKLKSVIFHAFPGTFAECESLLKRGINAYFSFGVSFSQKREARKNGELPKSPSVLIRGGKHAAECVARLPDDRLLLETDAAENAAELLPAVFSVAVELRGVSVSELEAVCSENFRRAYGA